MLDTGFLIVDFECRIPEITKNRLNFDVLIQNLVSRIKHLLS
jgi:hypothetical protein